MIVITGIPGSGKSTLAKKRFATYKRINLDTLKSRFREEAEILKALEKGENIVIDNTNTTRRSRKRYLDIAKSFGVPVRSAYLRCPLDLALKRNDSRRGREQIPSYVVKFYNRKLEPPRLDEGFDSCEVIDVDEGEQRLFT
jgi:predicted kinase